MAYHVPKTLLYIKSENIMKQKGNGNGAGSDWQNLGWWRNLLNDRTHPIVVNMQNGCVQEPLGKGKDIFSMVRELESRPEHVEFQVDHMAITSLNGKLTRQPQEPITMLKEQVTTL
jgi:hypothetical protein